MKKNRNVESLDTTFRIEGDDVSEGGFEEGTDEVVRLRNIF